MCESSAPVFKTEWDVEDIDRTSQFVHDCRLYNGGAVAPPEVRATWEGYDENGNYIGDDEDEEEY